MAEDRLCPPPEQTYSLHRTMAGVFLTAGKLKAKVHCLDIWNEVYEGYWADDVKKTI